MFKIGGKCTVHPLKNYGYKFDGFEVGTVIHVNKRLKQSLLLEFPHRKDLHDGNRVGGYPVSERRDLWWFHEEDLIHYNPVIFQYEEMM